MLKWHQAHMCQQMRRSTMAETQRPPLPSLLSSSSPSLFLILHLDHANLVQVHVDPSKPVGFGRAYLFWIELTVSAFSKQMVSVSAKYKKYTLTRKRERETNIYYETNKRGNICKVCLWCSCMWRLCVLKFVFELLVYYFFYFFLFSFFVFLTRANVSTLPFKVAFCYYDWWMKKRKEGKG